MLCEFIVVGCGLGGGEAGGCLGWSGVEEVCC